MPITDPPNVLPRRHLCEVRSLIHHVPDGRATVLTVALGFCPDDLGTPREVAYLGGCRSGSERERDLCDLCAVLSAALAHGLTPHDLGHPLGGDDPAGTAGGGSVAALLLAELAGQGAARGTDVERGVLQQSARPIRP